MIRTIASLLVCVALAACSQGRDGSGAAPGPSGSAAAAAAPKASTISAHDHGAHDHGAHGGGSDPKAHQDHNPRHGGVVTMEGDNHVEIVVGPDGAVDLFVSDAVRKPIDPAEVSGTIAIGPVGKEPAQTLALAADPKGSVSARGPKPAEKADYTWKLKVRGAPMSMTLTVPAGGTAALGGAGHDHAQGEHQHGSPHGGVVQTLGDGHAELKVERSGEVTLWLLDASEKPRSAKGAAATVRPVLAGAEEVKLEHDAAMDALRGKIAPPASERLEALVTVTPAGGNAATARFKLELQSGQGR